MTVAAAALPPVPASTAPLGAEAARYALLRRLAPSMRHHLVVNLQPIGMIYEVMDRRLRAAQPDIAHLHDSAHKINGFARAALASCLDVVSWLAPEEGAVFSVDDGVRECTSLLGSSLSFRGYTLRNNVPAFAGKVHRSAMRNVLTAMLIHATDRLPPPAELLLSAQESAHAVSLLLEIHAGTGDKGFTHEAAYRALEWADVQAVADAEGVGVSCEEGLCFTADIPWAPATS